MEALTVKQLYNLEETIAKELLEGVQYPWEALPKIQSFILELGETLSAEEYDKVGENVWIAKTASVAPTAYINGPAIIEKMQKSDIVHLSAEMRLLGKAQWLGTQQN